MEPYTLGKFRFLRPICGLVLYKYLEIDTSVVTSGSQLLIHPSPLSHQKQHLIQEVTIVSSSSHFAANHYKTI